MKSEGGKGPGPSTYQGRAQLVLRKPKLGNERMREAGKGVEGAVLGGARQSLIGGPGKLVCPLLPDLHPEPCQPPPRVLESALVSGAPGAGVGPGVF